MFIRVVQSITLYRRGMWPVTETTGNKIWTAELEYLRGRVSTTRKDKMDNTQNVGRNGYKTQIITY